MKNLSNGRKIDFLKWYIEEEVNVEQPTGYTTKWHENKVLKLNKAKA